MTDRYTSWMQQIAARDAAVVSMAGLALCAVIIWLAAPQWPGRLGAIVRVGMVGSFALTLVGLVVSHLHYLFGQVVVWGVLVGSVVMGAIAITLKQTRSEQ